MYYSSINVICSLAQREIAQKISHKTKDKASKRENTSDIKAVKD